MAVQSMALSCEAIMTRYLESMVASSRCIAEQLSTIVSTTRYTKNHDFSIMMIKKHYDIIHQLRQLQDTFCVRHFNNTRVMELNYAMNHICYMVMAKISATFETWILTSSTLSSSSSLTLTPSVCSLTAGETAATSTAPFIINDKSFKSTEPLTIPVENKNVPTDSLFVAVDNKTRLAGLKSLDTNDINEIEDMDDTSEEKTLFNEEASRDKDAARLMVEMRQEHFRKFTC